MTQSEYALEEALITQLKAMEYGFVRIDDEATMLANFKRQLEIHNAGISLSKTEFERILNHLNTGSVFERAKILRDKFALKRDNNETAYISFLNCDDWCLNEFQVTNQVTMQGKRKNRYDVTLLINGLPLVQVELKRRGAELKVAFHQVNRYHYDSYDAGFGLFQYAQLFVISIRLMTNQADLDDTELDKNGYAARIAHLIYLTGLNQSEFAKRLGVSAGFVSDAVRGLKKPGAEILFRIKAEFGVSIDWLLTGGGGYERIPNYRPRPA